MSYSGAAVISLGPWTEWPDRQRQPLSRRNSNFASECQEWRIATSFTCQLTIFSLLAIISASGGKISVLRCRDIIISRAQILFVNGFAFVISRGKCSAILFPAQTLLNFYSVHNPRSNNCISMLTCSCLYANTFTNNSQLNCNSHMV